MVYVYHSKGLLVVLGRIKLSKPPAENYQNQSIIHLRKKKAMSSSIKSTSVLIVQYFLLCSKT